MQLASMCLRATALLRFFGRLLSAGRPWQNRHQWYASLPNTSWLSGGFGQAWWHLISLPDKSACPPTLVWEGPHPDSLILAVAVAPKRQPSRWGLQWFKSITISTKSGGFVWQQQFYSLYTRAALVENMVLALATFMQVRSKMQ